jgi:hypothetical protein
MEVDEDECGAVGSDAAAHLDAIGYRSKCRRNVAGFAHPLSGGSGELVVQNRADIGDAATPIAPGDRAGLAIEPAIAFSVSQKHFCFGRSGSEQFGPDGGRAFAESAGRRYGFFESVKLFDVAAEVVGEIAGLAQGKQGIEIVLYPGTRAENQVTAVLHVGGEMLGAFFGNEIKVRRDDKLVRIEINVGANDVDGLGNFAQGLVVTLENGELIVLFGVFLPFDGPPTVVVLKQSNLGDHAGVAKCSLEVGEFFGGLRHLAEQGHGFAIRPDKSAMDFLLAI